MVFTSKVTHSFNKQQYCYSLKFIVDGIKWSWAGCHPQVLVLEWIERMCCFKAESLMDGVVPIHRLLETCLSVQLPIRRGSGLPILIWLCKCYIVYSALCTSLCVACTPWSHSHCVSKEAVGKLNATRFQYSVQMVASVCARRCVCVCISGRKKRQTQNNPSDIQQ